MSIQYTFTKFEGVYSFLLPFDGGDNLSCSHTVK